MICCVTAAWNISTNSRPKVVPSTLACSTMNVSGRVVSTRAGAEFRQSKKRQPPAKIHARLMPHLQRWRAVDIACGITSVVHYKGEAIRKLRHSWKSVAMLAGSRREDGPHILRHTAATWMMRSGVDAFEASGFLGMSPEVLWDVYGHHHPNFQTSAAAADGKRARVRSAEKSTHLPSNPPSDVLINLVSR